MQTQQLDSTPLDTLTGFRLDQLEVYNWGTFNGKIWTMTPGGYTALLTGANGAGKSTLVDALLTLLVPTHRRNYNQAAGQKRERDERSYVMGAYGKVRDDQTGSKVQVLRDKDSYSVLLARFCLGSELEIVTLAQIFWVDSSVNKLYLIARQPLSIQEDFSSFDTIRTLKSRLNRKKGVEVFTTFTAYSRRFRKLFGLRSDKALDLFSQIITIKEVGNLNQFVRNHMLEKTDARDRVEQLLQNYDNLRRAHEAILRAREQLNALRPMLKLARQFQEVEQAIRTVQGCIEILPAYFAGRKKELLAQAMAETQEARSQNGHRLESINRTLEDLRQQQVDLKIAINKDDTGQQLQKIAEAIRNQQAWLASRQKRAQQYDQLVAQVQLSPYRNEARFQEVRQQAGQLEQIATAKLTEREKIIREQETQRLKLKEEGDELNAELNSLRQRRSQIPAQNLGLRQRILQAVTIDEAEVPFVGELLQVKPDEKAWEGAIERLLHSFGLQLLVPEEHYRAISHYINRHHLGGRVVFERIGGRVRPPVPPTDRAALIDKLAIKPETPFADWLYSELSHRFDFVCCDDLEQFQRERRAITPSGFIKRGTSLHEKDDRYDIHDRRRYVLGWDNRDKIKAIEADLEKVRRRYSEVAQAINQAESEKKIWKACRDTAHDLLQFEDFAEIDWRPIEQEIRRLRQQQQELEQSSDRLQELKVQLENVTKRLAEAVESQKKAEEQIYHLERDWRDFQKQHHEMTSLMETVPAEAVERFTPQIEAQLPAVTLTLATIDNLRQTKTDQFYQQMTDLSQQASDLRAKVEKQMDRYKRQYPTETDHVDASVRAIDEFGRMLDTIERDDLPRHEKRFKEMVNDKAVNHIVSFKSALEAIEADIRENINTLNQSLRNINYSPATYIQLETESNLDVDVREFRLMLTDCLPDWANPDYEASYQKIKPLLDRFQEDHRWTDKVIDVRNWLNFSASERYREDDTEKHHYSDSSGKSGGQKAKLAYTILASAIAYQYSLEQGETRSKTFRLVVVDEAFSKSDEVNARYAMELFKNLQLQLLVVTPPKSTDIHIVEAYISAVHFVTNNEAENDSQVYNLTMTEYHQRKQEFLQAA